MRKNSKAKSIVVLAVLILAIVAFAYVSIIGIGPTGTGAAENINLGLDLAGGVSITYEAVDDVVSDEDMADTVNKLQKRAETYSSEAEVYQEGARRINIEIPGVSDANTILEEMGTPGSLYFLRSVGGESEVVMEGSDVKDAEALISEDPDTGATEYLVKLTLTDEAAQTFGEVTAESIGEQIAIIYDEELLSSPTVQQAITNGEPYISGMTTFEEAEELASFIRIGGLNLELEEIRSNVVSAKLGVEAIEKSLQAGAIGLLIVIIMMCIVYLVPGAVSGVGLILYTLMMLLILNAFDLTLTIAGIAGIILSIGMAVDANVIIFARIKEEIAAGNSVKASIKEGYKKAFSAIIDGNVTTLIAAGILMWRGYGSIRGFAQTLAIGIVLSMFIALVVTRIIINALYGLGVTNPKFFGAAKERKPINFVGKRHICMLISACVILIGAGFFVGNGVAGNNVLNFSLEFLGGTSTTVTFNEAMTVDEVELDVVPLIEEITGDGNIQTQVVQSEGNKQVIIKTRELNLDERTEMAEVLEEKYEVDTNLIQTENISSTVSGEMRSQAVIAVLIAVICMLIYIAFRFSDYRFGVSAVICLIHDVLVVVGAYAVFRIPVGNTFIACLLTIVGYCINSTIVIFDRIRENLGGKRTVNNLGELVNTSITQCLTRSIYTFFSTFIMVAVIYINGVTAIREFAAPLMVGLIAGLFSSNCLAAPIWYLLRGKGKAVKEK